MDEKSISFDDGWTSRNYSDVLIAIEIDLLVPFSNLSIGWISEKNGLMNLLTISLDVIDPGRTVALLFRFCCQRFLNIASNIVTNKLIESF